MADFLRRVVPERFRPIGYLTHLVRTRTNRMVRRGPFRGMRYVEAAVGSAYLPKLLGTYERELASIIEEICRLRPGLVIDMGAAEGYYAVGLACRTAAQVIAFERDAAGRAALQAMASLNRVRERIDVRGKCGPAELEAALEWAPVEVESRQNQPVVVVCDVEGDEDRLLDPMTVPGLGRVFLVVETHEFISPGVTDRIQRRFERTHAATQIWQTRRERDEFPYRTLVTRLLPDHYLDWAVSEWRPEQMSWLWMRPYG